MKSLLYRFDISVRRIYNSNNCDCDIQNDFTCKKITDALHVYVIWSLNISDYKYPYNFFMCYYLFLENGQVIYLKFNFVYLALPYSS